MVNALLHAVGLTVSIASMDPFPCRFRRPDAADAKRGNRLAMKVRDAIRLIENDGWYQVRVRGSHRQFAHPTKPGLVTIPGKHGDDLAIGTLNSVLKQAGLKR